MSTSDERENPPEHTPAEPVAPEPAAAPPPPPAAAPEPAAPTPQPAPASSPPPQQPYAAAPPPYQPAPPPQQQYAAAPPQQPYATGQPYAAAPPRQQGAKTWMNITSLVTSLLGLGLVGVIFGHLGVSAAKRGEADLKGLGIAGLILGYLQIIIGIIFLIAFLVYLGNCANDPACVDFWTELENSTS